MEMTKERLEAYKSNKEEIRELRYKLEHLGEGNSLIGNDVIKDYRTGYPRPQSVVGYDYDKEDRLRTTYQARIQKLEAECSEVELWIEAIPDSLTRRIFRMYYIDGLSQKAVAQKVHLDRSSISKKIDAYLKVSPNSHNSHV